MNVNTVIRTLRKQKRMTLERLAALTGLTKGYLSKIEHASKAPPFSTLELIARALEVDISYLLEKGASGVVGRNISVMRHGEWAVMDIDPGALRNGCSFTPLLHSYQGKYMTPVLVSIEPGTFTEFQHDAEEFVYVQKGRISLEYDEERWEFKENDSFYLDSRKRHRLGNLGSKVAVILSVYYTYRRF